MLPSLSFEGTTKVRNKGVDITLIADSETAGYAFQASRILAVRGINAAVLEMTCLEPFDRKTLNYFEQTTGKLIFLTPQLYKIANPYLESRTFAIVAERAEIQVYIKKIIEYARGKKEKEGNYECRSN